MCIHWPVALGHCKLWRGNKCHWWHSWMKRYCFQMYKRIRGSWGLSLALCSGTEGENTFLPRGNGHQDNYPGSMPVTVIKRLIKSSLGEKSFVWAHSLCCGPSLLGTQGGRTWRSGFHPQPRAEREQMPAAARGSLSSVFSPEPSLRKGTSDIRSGPSLL